MPGNVQSRQAVGKAAVPQLLPATRVGSAKLREAMARETTGAIPAGEVEIDGAYFGGHVRPTNARKDRVDRRLPKTAAASAGS